MTTETTPALQLDRVVRHYGDVKAVDDVSLVVRQGEFVTLLGPSGSGKTTTLRLVAGFVRAQGGTILVAGRDVTGVPPHKRDVGMVFQNFALFPHMTVGQNVAFPLQMRKLSKADQTRKVEEALKTVRLSGLHDRLPRQLSGGQQQRVAVARAIVFEPSILLMDEPLGALDRKLREALQLEVRRLHQQLGVTILYVTHDQEEALVLSDRVAIFRDGQIRQLGTPSDIYRRPVSAFVGDFIGDSNILRGRLEREGNALVVLGDNWRHTGTPTNGVMADAVGSSVGLFIRPEQMDLVPAGTPTPAGHDHVDGVVTQVIYLGADHKFELEMYGRAFMIRRSVGKSGRVPAVGDPVTVHWSPTDALIVADE